MKVKPYNLEFKNLQSFILKFVANRSRGLRVMIGHTNSQTEIAKSRTINF